LQTGFDSQQGRVYAFCDQTEKRSVTGLEMQKERNRISKKIFPSIFLLVLLTGSWVPAKAQVHSDASGEKHSAHIKRDPDADTARFIVEQDIPTKMQIPGIQFNSCQASITLEYYQRNTLARVESTVEHESCVASTGEYELLVNIIDENGVFRNLSFSETWEQKDDALLKISRDYPIGENVTLKRVVMQRIRCECTDL
jgi:hypothetical protein